jgi:hypothetical protein
MHSFGKEIDMYLLVDDTQIVDIIPTDDELVDYAVEMDLENQIDGCVKHPSRKDMDLDEAIEYLRNEYDLIEGRYM